MLRRFSVVMICVCWAISLSAQTQIISRLDLGKRSPKPQFYEYSPVDGGLITMGPMRTSSSRQVGLVKYDSDFKKQWSKKVMDQNGRKNIDFVTVIGANILVFVSEFFPREGVIKTYYYRYNLEGEIMADQEILSVYPNQKEQKVDLQYVLSPNKRTLLCYKNLQNRKESEQILYYLFDEEGDYVQNGEINIKYPDNRFRVRTVRVSNQGNVFLLGKFYIRTRVNDSDDFKYLMYRYDTQAQQGFEFPIELGDKFISDLAFRLDREENIYAAGFFSNRSTYRIAGTLLQQIDRNGQLIRNTSKEFSENFLSNYLTSGQIDRGRELQNFYLDSEDGIILRSDGGVLLIAEKYYVTYQRFRDVYGYITDREIFHYDDVILTSISGDGNIEWHAIIEKEQASESPATLSYFNAVGGGGAYIFYEYKPRRRDFNVYYNQVAMNGDVSQAAPLFDRYRFGYQFYPRFCEQINNNEAIMVYFQNRNNMLSVIKVKFDDA